MPAEYRSKHPSDLVKVASDLLNLNKDMRLYCLHGEMGVGKTTFIKALCKVLKVVDETSSPTYPVVNEYGTADGNKVYHFDFYRINNIEEAMDLGVEDYFESGSYCFVEWPEVIAALLPPDAIQITMTNEENERVIKTNL